MERMIIRLNSIKKVREFVDIVNQYNGEMNIKLGKYIVNAKYILGILCLELQNDLILEVESSENMSVLISKLEPYTVSDSYYL